MEQQEFNKKVYSMLTSLNIDNQRRQVIYELMKVILNGKQDVLESGKNIKTINDNSIIGNGNIDIKEDIELDWFEWNGVLYLYSNKLIPSEYKLFRVYKVNRKYRNSHIDERDKFKKRARPEILWGEKRKTGITTGIENVQLELNFIHQSKWNNKFVYNTNATALDFADLFIRLQKSHNITVSVLAKDRSMREPYALIGINDPEGKPIHIRLNVGIALFKQITNNKYERVNRITPIGIDLTNKANNRAIINNISEINSYSKLAKFVSFAKRY